MNYRPILLFLGIELQCVESQVKKTDEKRNKTKIAETTAIISIVVVALYFVSRYAGGLLGIDLDDSSAIFLSLIPFIVYLVVSGRISELKAGGFEVKLREAVGEKVQYEQQPVKYEEALYLPKGGYDVLDRLMEQASKGHPTTLGLIVRESYIYEFMEKYLKDLSKTEQAKYVVFSDKNHIFQGFAPLSLLAQTSIDSIINIVGRGDLENIPGLRRDFVQDAVSNKEALNIMESRKIPDAAVVDASGKFRGFTNKNIIMLSIVENLLTKI